MPSGQPALDRRPAVLARDPRAARAPAHDAARPSRAGPAPRSRRSGAPRRACRRPSAPTSAGAARRPTARPPPPRRGPAARPASPPPPRPATRRRRRRRPPSCRRFTSRVRSRAAIASVQAGLDRRRQLVGHDEHRPPHPEHPDQRAVLVERPLDGRHVRARASAPPPRGAPSPGRWRAGPRRRGRPPPGPRPRRCRPAGGAPPAAPGAPRRRAASRARILPPRRTEEAR